LLSENWLAELKAECQAEINGEFSHRIHYSKGTYASGCRGPMCRKAERDKTKERQEAKYRKSGLPYRPQVDDHETCIREDALNLIIFYHRYSRDKMCEIRTPVYPADWFDRVEAV
jgi:hypothetical protein